MNEQVSIDEMNEAIALFMGGSSVKEHGSRRYVYYPKACAKAVADLKYHSSWDWLMPVIKRIEIFLQDDLKKRPPHTATHGDWIEVDIHCALREVDIVKTHGFVYQFVEWFNQYIKNKQP